MAEELFEGNGNRKKTLYPTYDIKTSNDDYRLTFKFVTTDTNDINNKGIWSLYIIKSKNDANLDVAYRGDNEYTIGIHINISNIIEED